jgi:hypothetical protein
MYSTRSATLFAMVLVFAASSSAQAQQRAILGTWTGVIEQRPISEPIAVGEPPQGWQAFG